MTKVQTFLAAAFVLSIVGAPSYALAGPVYIPLGEWGFEGETLGDAPKDWPATGNVKVVPFGYAPLINSRGVLIRQNGIMSRAYSMPNDTDVRLKFWHDFVLNVIGCRDGCGVPNHAEMHAGISGQSTLPPLPTTITQDYVIRIGFVQSGANIVGEDFNNWSDRESEGWTKTDGGFVTSGNLSYLFAPGDTIKVTFSTNVSGDFFGDTGRARQTVDNRSPTPEPSTWLLLSSGLAGLMGWKFRSTKKTAA
jgi:hypothetical protein